MSYTDGCCLSLYIAPVLLCSKAAPYSRQLLALNSLEAGAQIREPPKVWTASPTQHTSLDFVPLAPEVCSWVMEKMKVIPVRDPAQSICFGSAECHTAHRSHQTSSAHMNSCVFMCSFTVQFIPAPWAQCTAFFFFCLFRATSMAHGSSQAGGLIRAAVVCPHHSHSNTRSLAYRVRPGIEPVSSQRQHQVLNPLSHNRNASMDSFYQKQPVLEFLSWLGG